MGEFLTDSKTAVNNNRLRPIKTVQSLYYLVTFWHNGNILQCTFLWTSIYYKLYYAKKHHQGLVLTVFA